MKITKAVSLHPALDEIVAKFGPVHLVRKAEGRHNLTGGTPTDRAKARKWCAQHTPFVKLIASRRPRRRNFQSHLREKRPTLARSVTKIEALNFTGFGNPRTLIPRNHYES
jgi:hypothetical protein